MRSRKAASTSSSHGTLARASATPLAAVLNHHWKFVAPLACCLVVCSSVVSASTKADRVESQAVQSEPQRTNSARPLMTNGGAMLLVQQTSDKGTLCTTVSIANNIKKIPFDSARIAAVSDTVQYSYRHPDSLQMQRALSKADYNYRAKERNPGPSVLDQILEWLSRHLLGNLPSNMSISGLKMILYGALVVMLVLVVLWLAKGGMSGVVQKGSPSLSVDFEEEALHLAEEDLRLLCEKAIQQKEYRRALRFLFLLELRALVDSGVLVYDAAKTNRHYVRELGSSPLRMPFQQLNLMYERVWYGGYDVQADEFTVLHAQFRQFAELRIAKSSRAVEEHAL